MFKVRKTRLETGFWVVAVYIQTSALALEPMRNFSCKYIIISFKIEWGNVLQIMCYKVDYVKCLGLTLCNKLCGVYRRHLSPTNYE